MIRDEREEVFFRNKMYAGKTLRKIGGGGAGDVYELVGAQSDDGQKVAVKIFRSRGKTCGVLPYNRFRDEVTFVLEDIIKEHGLDPRFVPLVVPFKWYHLPEKLRKGEKAWYSMPLLEAYNKNCFHGPSEIIDCLLQVLDSLAFIHQHGGAHRDIKGKNILKLPDGRWALSDYGMVFFDNPKRQAATLGGNMKIYGGPIELHNMDACEKLKDKLSILRKSDIYLFGKLCWQLLSEEDLYFEGPFVLSGDAMKRFLKKTDSYAVPLSPMIRIFLGAILDDYGDRCDLDFIKEQLCLQKTLIEMNERGELNAPLYQKELNCYIDFKNIASFSSCGSIAKGEDALSVLNKYAGHVSLSIEGPNGSPKNVAGSLYFSVADGLFYIDEGPIKYAFSLNYIALFLPGEKARFEAVTQKLPSAVTYYGAAGRVVLLDGEYRIRCCR